MPLRTLRDRMLPRLGRVAKRVFPQTFKGITRTVLERWLLAGMQRADRPIQGRATVAGLFTSGTGIGEAARHMYHALHRLGYSPAALDLSASFGQSNTEWLPLQEDQPPAQIDGAPLIVQLNADDSFAAFLLMGKDRYRNRRRIGYWYWELPVAPRRWRQTAQLFDEIWVASQFVREALERTGIDRVRVVRPVMELMEAAEDPADSPARRDGFTILSIIDLRSSIARKNPLAVIAAFQQSLPGREDGNLVLKISGAQQRPRDFATIVAKCQDNPRIRIIDRYLDHASMSRLITDADVYLSLHRSEGFGLPMAEACLRGTPVVATGWSGNMEFMQHPSAFLVDYSLVPVEDQTGLYRGANCQWANPSIESAVALLDALYSDSRLRVDSATQMKNHVTKILGLKEFGSNIEEVFRIRGVESRQETTARPMPNAER